MLKGHCNAFHILSHIAITGLLYFVSHKDVATIVRIQKAQCLLYSIRSSLDEAFWERAAVTARLHFKRLKKTCIERDSSSSGVDELHVKATAATTTWPGQPFCFRGLSHKVRCVELLITGRQWQWTVTKWWRNVIYHQLSCHLIVTIQEVRQHYPLLTHQQSAAQTVLPD